MPITFNSPDDPYGIAAAGSILGNALLRKNQEALQNRRQLQSEARQDQRQLGLEQRQEALQDRNRPKNLQYQTDLQEALDQIQAGSENRKIEQNKYYYKKQGNILSQALEGVDINTPQGLQSAMLNFSKLGGEADPAEILKSLSSQQTNANKASANPKLSIYQKKAQEATADYIIKSNEDADIANASLREFSDLRQAINSDKLKKQTVIGRAVSSTLQSTPLAGVILSPEEQTISTKGKQIITDFTNLKGIRLTDAKLKWLENATPKIGKTVEANNRAADIIENLLELKSKTPEIIQAIIEKNGGEPPDDLILQVNKVLGTVLNDYIDSQPDFGKGQSFEKMPPAKEYKGRILNNGEGKRYKSDGKGWKEIK